MLLSGLDERRALFRRGSAIRITRGSATRWSATLALVGRPHRHADAVFPRSTRTVTRGACARSSRFAGVVSLLRHGFRSPESIREEIASLATRSNRPGSSDEPSPGRRLEVLRRLNDICTPGRSVVARRGERKPCGADGRSRLWSASADPSAPAWPSRKPGPPWRRSIAAIGRRLRTVRGSATLALRRALAAQRREHGHAGAGSAGGCASDDGDGRLQRFRLPVARADARHESDHSGSA